MYAVNDRRSFNNISSWMSQISQYHDETLPKVLVGNKCDLDQERVVSSEEGKIMADSYNIPFVETSAMESININEIFIQLGRLIAQRQPANPTRDGTISINFSGQQEPKKKGCCGN